MSKKMEKGTENAIFLDGRGYTAADLYRLIGLLVGNGVYANELAPTATNEDMSITHGVGHAWISGIAYWNTTPFVLDIATADGSLNRYDSLMLRLNLSINEVYAVIVQGAYATNPTPPACTRNAETFDLKICDIYIPAGCTKITQAQITDTRLDSSVCGVPVFPVEHLDMSTFYKQVSADLDTLHKQEQALIDKLREEISAVKDGSGYLLKSGGVPTPENDDQAANKGYVDSMMNFISIALPASGWVDNSQTVNVAGVLADEDICSVIISAVLNDREVYSDCGVQCTAQLNGQLTFGCENAPTTDLTINVVVLIKGGGT